MQVREEGIRELRRLGVEVQTEIQNESNKREILISAMEIPYLYKLKERKISRTNVELEKELEEAEKRRFYYFIEVQLEHYRNIEKQLITMLESKFSLLFLIPVFMIGLGLYSIITKNTLLGGVSLGLFVVTYKYFNPLSSVDVQNKQICENCLKYVQELIAKYANMDVATQSEILEQIEKQKNKIILKRAKEACGIEDSDIKSEKIVILDEFAFLQDVKLSGYKSLDKSYMESYKFIETEERKYYISPCLYIKYIFILNEKIETFSIFYDAIRDKTYGRDIQSFYYEDISKVSESDEEVNNFEVTKFEVAINSGDKILINLKNEQTIEQMKANSNTTYDKELEDANNNLKTATSENEKKYAEEVIAKLKKQKKEEGEIDVQVISTAILFSKNLKIKIKELKKSILEPTLQNNDGKSETQSGNPNG